MSQAYHDLLRTRMARGAWRDKVRPILLNSWEAAFFDFDEDRLVQIASSASELGVELFVVDDGWFGRRDDDTTSLGDWQPDRRKLPGGLESLGAKVEALGMRLGLWIEPEMISRASHLYEAHPEWEVGIPSRPRTASRNQYVLDMSRPEVVDHLFEVLSKVLGSAQISYVKWDMNRFITEPFSVTLPAWRQGEFMHRHILGVYSLYERLTKAFPGILFESCASGGARFDPGMLAFAPQAWTSDNNDAVDRLKIQYGTSLVYPLSSMGAHVAAVPNHDNGRVTSLTTRALVAFFGDFGYELDPTKLPANERDAICEQVAFYKRWREVFQFGHFHRLAQPVRGRRQRDRLDGRQTRPQGRGRGPLPGLEPGLSRTAAAPPARTRPGRAVSHLPLAGIRGARPRRPEVGGDALMAAGLVIEAHRVNALVGDFHARLYVLEADDSVAQAAGT